MSSESRTSLIIIAVILVALVVVVVVLGGDGTLQGTAIGGQEQPIVDLMNAARGQRGTAPASLEGRLNTAAAAHCQDMLKTDTLTHVGSDGSQVWDRVSRVGYDWATVGENVLFRWDPNPTEAYNQWWNSPGHQANMLNGEFTQVGVAACLHGNGKYYYVMVLAAPF